MLLHLLQVHFKLFFFFLSFYQLASEHTPSRRGTETEKMRTCLLYMTFHFHFTVKWKDQWTTFKSDNKVTYYNVPYRAQIPCKASKTLLKDGVHTMDPIHKTFNNN